MAKKLPSATFDDVAAAFADYGTSVRGYVRYQLTQRNLLPFIEGKQLRILDVGGGSGGDAAWLAGLGHLVTFIEPSTEQRRFAERRFNFLLDDEERQRVNVAGETMDDIDPQATFDLVLLHTVALFQAEPAAFITKALSYVEPGGLVSIIEKGYYGVELRDIHDGNYDDLRRLHATSRSINDLGQDAYASKPEELEALLTAAGFRVLEWSGIRLITDDFNMSVESLGAAQMKHILEVEYEHGHNLSIRGQGQLLQFIARKSAK
ncbi:methyltransferase domain-containing protein [soil metagenome]